YHTVFVSCFNYHCDMDPIIKLEPQWHEGRLFICVSGKLRADAFRIVNNWAGRRYSATHRCYLILYERDQLTKLAKELSDFIKVDLSGWGKPDNEMLPHALTQAWIAVPDTYGQTLRKIRYSEATTKNYESQFKSFLSFIYPKT